MARGQYELPPVRPRPAFGPPRPPKLPTRSSSDPSPSATSLLAPVASKKSRAVIIVLSMLKSEPYESQVKFLKTKVESEADVEEIETVNDAVRAFARKPHAVIVNEEALRDPSLEIIRSEATRYIQSGGILVTDLSRIPPALEQLSKMKNVSVDNLSTTDTGMISAGSLRTTSFEPKFAWHATT